MPAPHRRFRVLPLLLAASVMMAMVLLLVRHHHSTVGEREPVAEVVSASGSDVVFLISLDGFSGTYLNPEDAPRFSEWKDRAVFSRQLLPPFPSLTFPSHVTIATGRTVSGHGIPGNSFYDRERAEELRFPGDSSLLLAEPIWTSAARQGLRVLSYDWPLSHQQEGPYATTYFESRFDSSLTDEDRIERVLDLWEKDPERSEGDAPLRLITAYAKEADSVGHRSGPGASETREAAREVDALMHRTRERAARIFDSNRKGDEQLYFIFAADHGMSEITHHVNVDVILGPELTEKFISLTGGNVGNLYLRDPAASDAQEALAELDRVFESVPFARVYTEGTLPEEWSYAVAGRTGDRVVVLDPGHAFNRSGVRPRVAAEVSGGLRGMHGHSSDLVPEMAGMLLIARHPDPLPEGLDLGPVSATSIHATIARLLEIEPAPHAEPEGLSWRE